MDGWMDMTDCITLLVNVVSKTSCMLVTDEEEDEAQPSFVTSKHVSLQLVVPGHAVGAVIGQQGTQIKQVALQQSECIISLFCSVYG